jgi:hypothetical protein
MVPRWTGTVPGEETSTRDQELTMARKLLLVAAAALAAGIFLKRDKVAGLLPGRGETYEPPATPPPPPGPSNYDAPGPVANTATPVPAPEPQEAQPVDEAAEEAAAALEAANIGGVVSDYAGSAPDERADEAERPLAEAGEGVAEGEEQAEFDLQQAAEPTAPGMSDTERQIDDAIEQAANPLAGEQVEPVRPVDESETADAREAAGWSPPVPERSDEPAPFAAPADEETTTEFEPPSPEPPADADQLEPPAATDQPEAPAAADTPEPPADEEKKDEGGSDWRTWSGRSINP